MYKYGEYLLTSGWGGIGIYNIDAATGIEKSSGRHIIPEDGVVAGTGSGYEEFIFNDFMCEAIVAILNYSPHEAVLLIKQLITEYKIDNRIST
jgi:hypothetical protein